MITTQSILSEFGFDKKQFKAAESDVLKSSSTVKLHYLLRYLGAILALILLRDFSARLLPDMPWILHFAIGLVGLFVVVWAMTRYITNPVLVTALRQAIASSAGKTEGEQVENADAE